MAQEARVRLAELAIRLRDGRRGATGPWFELSVGTVEAWELETALEYSDCALEFMGKCLPAVPGRAR